MANLTSSRDESVSLFPMFSILACTLGILILFMGAITSISVGPELTTIIEIEKSRLLTHSKTPVYIEWEGSQITLHPSLETTSLDFEISGYNSFESYYRGIDKQIDGTTFEVIVEKVRRQISEYYFVVLVRPSGFKNFSNFKNYLTWKGFDIGYEPVEQEKKYIVENKEIL